MNPFLNPRITLPFIKNYILDPGRMSRLSSKQMEKYIDKQFRKIVSLAYTVPIYHKKYKNAGIHPSNIRGVKDIQKLPFVHRSDFNENFPDGVVPKGFDTEKGNVICTGGTTGRYCCTSGAEPVCIYSDLPSILKSFSIIKRESRVFNFSLRKSKIAHLGNFNPFKIDEVFEKNIMSKIKAFIPIDNYLTMNASEPIEQIIEKLDAFQPDVIVSYPILFHELAYYKRHGKGKNINPKCLKVGGTMLDDYTRRYVEDAFGCRMFNEYASCEAGANIAYESTCGNWHIHSDYFHLESVDENLESVNPGKRGHIVLTKLWGSGTPIIRYTGMNDWITLGNGKKCECGHNSPIFAKPVEGRVESNIILPDGRVFPPSSFLFIANVLKDLKTFKVRRYQVLQKAVNEIDILLVIDKGLRNKGPSVKKISDDIIKVYQKEAGSSVTIKVIEVDNISDDAESGKPAPIILSEVPLGECKFNN